MSVRPGPRTVKVEYATILMLLFPFDSICSPRKLNVTKPWKIAQIGNISILIKKAKILRGKTVTWPSRTERDKTQKCCCGDIFFLLNTDGELSNTNHRHQLLVFTILCYCLNLNHTFDHESLTTVSTIREALMWWIKDVKPELSLYWNCLREIHCLQLAFKLLFSLH